MYKGRTELQKKRTKQKKRLSAKKNLTLNTGGHNVQTFRNDHIYNTFNWKFYCEQCATINEMCFTMPNWVYIII